MSGARRFLPGGWAGCRLRRWPGASTTLCGHTSCSIEVRDTRTWWRHRLEAIGLTVWFSVLTIAALLLFAFGERIGDAVAQWLGVGAMFTRTWNIARWPALLLFALVGIMLVYQLAPAA